MPDEKTFRRRRAVFLLLVLAAFVLLTGSFVGAFGGAERGFAGIVSPIQEGASKVAKPARDLVNWVGDTFRAKGDLEDVRKERDQLQVANGVLVQKLEQTGQQAALDEVTASAGLAQYGPVEVSLLAQSTSAWYRTIRISKGSGDGIAINNPVMAPNGLVGKVISVQGGSAVVRLITDPESGVTAKIDGGGELRGLRGSLRPADVGAAGDLVLESFPRTREADVGDLVLTAGSTSQRLESRFPGGIPIGKVSRIEKEDSLSQVIHVEPLADLRRLDVLRVLTSVEDANPTTP